MFVFLLFNQLLLLRDSGFDVLFVAGFGGIGRLVARAVLERDDMQVVAINDAFFHNEFYVLLLLFVHKNLFIPLLLS